MEIFAGLPESYHGGGLKRFQPIMRSHKCFTVSTFGKALNWELGPFEISVHNMLEVYRALAIACSILARVYSIPDPLPTRSPIRLTKHSLSIFVKTRQKIKKTKPLAKTEL